MRGRPAIGYRRTPKIIALEAEFDLTFPEIIAGFVSDGMNKDQTAAVLDIDPKELRRKLKGLAIAGITFDWPNGMVTRIRDPYPRTEAQLQAQQANLELMLAKTGNRRKVHPDLVPLITNLRQQKKTWHTIARELNVNVSTLRRNRRSFEIPDPIDNALQKEAWRKYKNLQNRGLKYQQC